MSDTTGTTGGAPTFSTKISFADVASAVVPKVVSSSASDTATTLAIYSLTSAGVLQNETVTLTGTTAANGTLTAARLMKGVQGGTTAVGDIAILGNELITAHAMQAGTTNGATLQSGDGASCALGDIIQITNNTPSGIQYELRSIVGISGDVVVVNRAWGTTPSNATTYNVWSGMLFDLLPNQITQVRRIFYGAYAQAGGGSTNTWYEKIFASNDNTATTLTAAAILKEIDPVNLYTNGGSLNFALCNALDDTSTITTNLNPGSGPSGVTSYSSGAAPQSINVPSPQNLVNGSAPNTSNAQGIWIQLVLPAGTATVNSFADMRITGQTT
jgi:hypothetical protein